VSISPEEKVIDHRQLGNDGDHGCAPGTRIAAFSSRQSPGFIIIGAQKGGTTSLYRYLTAHPDVGEASKKEVHFYDRAYKKGMSWYLAHFPERGIFPLVGESSPSYLFHPKVPERIQHTLPEAKLIVLLRNPIDRAYSQYQMRLRRVGTNSFEADLDHEFERLKMSSGPLGPEKGEHAYLARGHYAEQLERWFAVFPREQLLILQSETFFAQPGIGLAQTLAFLDLRSWQPADYDVHNSGAYTDMHPETRARLAAYFAPHNQRLYELLGQDFGWDHV
jgi:Sulfotransferase domain